MKLTTLLLVALAATSCGPYYVGRKPIDPAEELMAAIPEVVAEETAPMAEPLPGLGTDTQEPVVEQPLIGWDGQEITTEDRPLHGLESDAGTRSYLIDLYVKSKERVDELEATAESLHELLASQEHLITERDSMLTDERDQVTQLEGQLAAERARIADLEARLVTAQIRRLEAERQLLLNLLGAEDIPVVPDTAVASAAGVE